jgi:ABC-type lipoprotein release transport system permease subunit
LLGIATLFGAELRNRLRSWLFLAFLVAIVSGTVLAGLAAGQRTATAYPRFVASYGFDAYAFALHPVPAIASLPDVTTSVLMRSPSAGNPSCSCGHTINPTYFGIAEIPPTSLGRFVKLVSGHLPHQSNPTEVLASFSFAQDVGVGVGTHIRVPLAGKSPSAAPTANGSTVAPGGPVVTLTVVGIEAADVEFQSSSYPYFDVFTTTAFARRYNPQSTQIAAYFVRLRGGVNDLPRFQTEARKLGALSTTDLDTTEASNEASIHPQAVGWWLLAGAAGFVGLVIIFQALARQALLESADFETLTALGMSRRQLVAFGLTRTAFIATAGALGGIALAYGLSPLAPVGEPRIAEPSTGFAFDIPILLLGVVATVLAVTALGLWPAIRNSHRAASRATPLATGSKFVSLLRRSGAPPSTVIGVGRAIERGRGDRAVPVGSALLGMILAVTTLSGTVVFGASLTHLTTTPALYGQPFDAVFSNNGTPGSRGPSPVLRSLLGDRHIPRITAGIGGDVAINGRTVDAIASKSIRGATLLTAISGRLPQHDNEVTLGATTMRLVNAHVGSTVRVSAPSPDGGTRISSYKVVGVAAFPPDFGAGGLGTGATFSVGGLLAAQCAPGLNRSSCEKQASGNPNENYLVRATPDHIGRVALLKLAKQYSSSVQFPMAPTNLVNFGQAVNFPLILSLVIILFGLATLVHVLVVSLVRRANESQVLLTIGFVRRQVALTVIWQALAIALIAVIVGIPLGVALGRLIWRLFADNLGVVSIPIVVIASISLVGIGTLVSALLLAVWPALAAARHSTGGLMRDER